MVPRRLSAPAFPADVLFMKNESVIVPAETSAAPPLAFTFVFTFPMNTLRVMDPLERTAPPPLPLWLFKKVLSEIVTLPFRAPPPPAPALLLLKKLLVTTEVPSTAPPAVALLFVKVTPLKVPPPPTAPPPPKTPAAVATLLSKVQLLTANPAGPPEVGPPMFQIAAPSLAWWPFRIGRWLSVRWPVVWRVSKVP